MKKAVFLWVMVIFCVLLNPPYSEAGRIRDFFNRVFKFKKGPKPTPKTEQKKLKKAKPYTKEEGEVWEEDWEEAEKEEVLEIDGIKVEVKEVGEVPEGESPLPDEIYTRLPALPTPPPKPPQPPPIQTIPQAPRVLSGGTIPQVTVVPQVPRITPLPSVPSPSVVPKFPTPPAPTGPMKEIPEGKPKEGEQKKEPLSDVDAQKNKTDIYPSGSKVDNATFKNEGSSSNIDDILEVDKDLF